MKLEFDRYDALRLLAIIGIAVLAFCGFQDGCSGGGTGQTDTTKAIRIIPKVKPLTIQWNSPEPDSVIQTDTVSRIKYIDTTKIDTPALVKDYLRKRFYSRTFKDSNYTAHLKAEVFRNRLDSVALEAEVRYDKEVITKTVTKRPNFLLQITGGPRSIQPGALYRKGDWYFGGGYEFSRAYPGGVRVTIARSF